MADDPLLRKRQKRAPIGWERTVYRCLDCEPDELVLYQYAELREGDDAGQSLTCSKCGAELAPAAAKKA